MVKLTKNTGNNNKCQLTEKNPMKRSMLSEKILKEIAI
jgi:hypothetical protein